MSSMFETALTDHVLSAALRDDPRRTLQQLRDVCELCCHRASEYGDRDSADAYERIGIGLDELQRKSADDIRTIEARMPLPF